MKTHHQENKFKNSVVNSLGHALLVDTSHQGGIKFKPELRVRNQDYGGMKVDHFVVEKR